VQVDLEEIRGAYRERMKQSIEDLAREADLRQIQHRLIDTLQPYIEAIEAYLGFRADTGHRR